MSAFPVLFRRQGAALLGKLREAPAELGLMPLVAPRRLNACCCGLSKTGTHSLAGIFGNYRSKHHPDVALRLKLSMQHLRGALDAPALREALKRRDRRLWLEMESSTLAGILIEPFVEACPEKKFILTLRDVYSWCDSWIDQNLNTPLPPKSGFAELDRIRLQGERFPPTKHDRPLIERGFPSLAAFFQLWASHNRRVLQAVPPDRLLIVKMSEIGSRLSDIARFVGVAPETLRAERAWLARATRKHAVLLLLDPSYVRDTAERYCGTLMARHFPAVEAC
jgi:hypothetical protein